MAKTLPSRKEDYAGWYNALVKQAGLAENGPARGSMIMKPYGFAIWEEVQRILDQAFKATGHENAYFPLLIPKSYLSREAAHVEGFAKECAVVTHYRLRTTEDGKGVEVDPAAKLEEELIVRPTSETVIWESYRRWIKSYRDLPLLINQWANVVRWEMRTRLFLRTAEFLWQEGHTAHATRKEAEHEAQQMLDVYTGFIQEYMAMPVLQGRKTEHEKFAGAETTYTMELLMQDGKALQAGTSHFLGQNFAKAFNVQFTNTAGKLEHVWGTSWGVTTRLIGAMIMTHSDDDGLVLPPKLAPIQVVIVPIYNSEQTQKEVNQVAYRLKTLLEEEGLRVKLDDRDTHKPGWKFAEYELKGVPLRIALGPKDLAEGTVELARRDTKEKQTLPIDRLTAVVQQQLDDIQHSLHRQATERRDGHITHVDTYEDFKEALRTKRGFVVAHWDGTTATEKKIQEETKATIRCIPLDGDTTPGKCIYTGKPSQRTVVFAEAY